MHALDHCLTLTPASRLSCRTLSALNKATILYVPRLGSASSSTGVLWELEAIAAVIIGGTVLKGGFGRVWGTVVGVLILGLIGNILNLTDWVSPYLNGAIQGVIIVLAVILQREGRPEG